MSLKKFLENGLYNYGKAEAWALNKITPILQNANISQENIGATAQMYGYPEFHGNVETNDSERRNNMPTYLHLVSLRNRLLNVSTMILSAPITEAKDQNREYINPTQITEAQAAKKYLENIVNDRTRLIALDSPHTEGNTMMAEQLHTSIKELRRLGHKNIIVHCRIQDFWRVSAILKEMKKYGKIQTDESTMVHPHSWIPDNGDTKGSALAALFKRGKDSKTIKNLI